ncbi:MAG: hypothetical protein JWN04_4340 [Myxococcaceae bacterium]|nr:hypothetical protein [Myxococcaceae bacterium]
MRFRGMMVALSLLAWGCGDDSDGSSTDGSIDASTPPSSDSGIHILPDAHYSDGGLVYVGPDGAIVMFGPDGAVLPDGSATDSGAPDAVVAVPCTGAFELVSPTGVAPLFEAVRCNPTGAVATQYDWGEGSGFEATPTHRYTAPGTFTVTQKASDGSTSTASVTVTSFTPVKFSATDHTVFNEAANPHTALVTVSSDGFEIAQGNGVHDIYPSAARSDGSIAAGSGVFYFEGRRLTDKPWYRGLLGISTGPTAGSLPPIYDFNAFPDNNHGSAVYNMGDGKSYTADGSCATSTPLDVTQLDTGYVVDYRGASPILYLVQSSGGAAAVLSTCTTTLTGPMFIYFAGERAEVYNELRINTGADTTNRPFFYSDAAVRAAVNAVDPTAATALVMGFGKTNAGRLDSPPTLTVPGDMSVALNQPVTLTGSASDVEDGDLSSKISWVDHSLQYAEQMPTVGASFSFTPTKYGVHPIIVKVRDLDGVLTTKTVKVTVSGKPPQADVVHLVAGTEPDAALIHLSSDGLQAGFNTNYKDGVRANQSILGDYWYFEVHRNNPTRNLGIGLVTEDGGILPYDFDPVPWSCSINILNTGETYINLIYQKIGDGSGWETNGSAPVHEDYGFAVDYRGENPLVHVIIGNKLYTTLKLSDVFVPIFPMLYGNGPESMAQMPQPYDFRINFGATAFNMDPVAALNAAMVDATGLKLGWGVSAH